MSQQRIQYIDAAKGMCMLFIVASHVHFNVFPLSAIAIRVLLFFVLAGLTFSSDSSPILFIKKKAKRLLVPFLFFYIVSYIAFYIGKQLIPGFSGLTEAKGIMDIFRQDSYFNGPLWFLLSLFTVNISAYAINRITRNVWLRILIYSLLGMTGYVLARYNIDLNPGIDSALTAMPFFMLGNTLASSRILEKIGKSSEIVIVILAMAIFKCFPFYAVIAKNNFDCSLMRFWLVGAITCIGYLTLAKVLCNIRFLRKSLAYVGYRSLYIMCTHHLIYRPFEMLLGRYLDGCTLSSAVFVLTILTCLLTEVPLSKYLPVIVGESDRKSRDYE